MPGGVDTLAQYLVNQYHPIQLFHCVNDPSSHVKKAKTLNLKEYASRGTGSEALTVIDKTRCIIQPYFSSLRGYEGLGLIRLADLVGCPIVLGDVTPRYYSSSSGIRLSTGRGFIDRAGKIAIGHAILISRYSRYLTFRRKLKIACLILVYTLVHAAYKFHSKFYGLKPLTN